MSAFLDFICGSYFGGLLWLGLGFLLIISGQKSNDWRKSRTDAQSVYQFLGICIVIFGSCVILNLIYNHFNQP